MHRNPTCGTGIAHEYWADRVSALWRIVQGGMMEKVFEPRPESSGTERFPLRKEAPAPKKVQILGGLDAALEAFDKMEDEAAVEYIVVPPPIPTDKEVQQHLLRNALLLIDGGEFPLARNVLGDVLRRDNNCVEAIRWMGWCFKQEGALENALKCYEQLVQLRVTDQDLFELGEIYYSLKRDQDAQSTWMDALGQCDAESPRLFDLHKNLGNVFFRLGDLDGAEENYNKALIIRPASDVLQVNLGSLNFQRQKYKMSMEFFKRALELNPYNDKGWCGVALVAREMKDDEWAWAVLLKSLDINPFNQTALQVLVNWAQADLKWDQAISRVQRYIEEFQEDGEMMYTLAGLLYQKGDLNAAELELIRLEAFDPSRADVAELKNLIATRREQIATEI